MKSKGFTLVELVLALLITSILTIILYSTFSNEIKTYVSQKKINSLKNNMNLTLHFIERDLRMAGFDPLGNANVGFERVDTDMMVFSGLDTTASHMFSDNDDLLRYAYYYDQTEKCIKRGTDYTTSGFTKSYVKPSEFTGASTQVKIIGYKLAENIESFQIEYFGRNRAVNQSFNNIVNPIKSVDITLSAKLDLWGRPPFYRTIKRTIECRNMGI